MNMESLCIWVRKIESGSSFPRECAIDAGMFFGEPFPPRLHNHVYRENFFVFSDYFNFSWDEATIVFSNFDYDFC